MCRGLETFRGFCHQRSDSQLPPLYYQEKTAGRDPEAQMVFLVAASRGINVFDYPNEYVDGVHQDDHR